MWFASESSVQVQYLDINLLAMASARSHHSCKHGWHSFGYSFLPHHQADMQPTHHAEALVGRKPLFLMVRTLSPFYGPPQFRWVSSFLQRCGNSRLCNSGMTNVVSRSGRCSVTEDAPLQRQLFATTSGHTIFNRGSQSAVDSVYLKRV